MAEIVRNSIVVPVDDGMIRIADFKEVVDPSVPLREISPIISEGAATSTSTVRRGRTVCR